MMKNQTALVPKQFLTAPVFASKPQKESRQLVVAGKEWTIGGLRHPLDLEKKSEIKPALDIRHGKLIFLMLAKFKTYYFDGKTSVHFSIHELAKEYYGVYGGTEHRKIKALLYDLQQTFIQIQVKKNEAVTFAVIKGANYREKYRKKKDVQQAELWLEDIQLSERFIEYLLQLENMLHIRLDVLFGLESTLAQAIYTYIPSRAWHRDNTNPFEITLSNLLDQLGEGVPKYKSDRYRKFFRHDRRYDIDVISDLDKKALNGNKRLRCNLADTQDGKDYKLQFWTVTSKKLRALPKGSLWESWEASGRSYEEWNEKLSLMHMIYWDSYELDALEEIPKWKDNESFFKMSKALLGSTHFSELLGEVKNCLREGRDIDGKPVQNPGAYLNDMICRALQQGKLD